MKNRVKTMWQKKDFRVFIFTVFNALISFVLFELALPQYVGLSVFLVPILNMITKRINTSYFSDLGVSLADTTNHEPIETTPTA